MEAVYENWFDYEVNGKVPFSLIESQFNEEYDNFMKMMNAIDICNESGIATISLNENAIADKIKEIWHKFKLWVNGVVNKIKSLVVEFKAKIDSYKNAIKSISKIDWEKISQDYDKRYIDFWNSKQDIIDVEYTITESTLSGSEKYMGIKMLGREQLSDADITDADKIIKYLDDRYPDKMENTFADLIHKVAKNHDSAANEKILDTMDDMREKIDDDDDDYIATIKTSIESKFSNDPEKYSEYLINRLENLYTAENKYLDVALKIRNSILQLEAVVNSHLASGKYNDITVELYKMIISFNKRKLKTYNALVDSCRNDGSTCGQNLAFTLKKKSNTEEK